MGLLDLVFPKKCLGCGQAGDYVCKTCDVGLWEADQVCPACGRPSEGGMVHNTCNHLSGLDGVTCIWTNDGLAKKLISNAVKYHHFDYLCDLVDKSSWVVKREEFRAFRQWVKNYNPTVLSFAGPGINKEDVLIVAKKVTKLIGLNTVRNITSGTNSVILVGILWHAEILKTASMLKRNGVKQIWGLVLAK